MAEEIGSTDCLVLKIEDNNEMNNLTRHVIYILYDVNESCYVVRGLNIQTGWAKNRPEDCPYSFMAKNVNSLADFIMHVIPKHNTVREVLYNYDNLPQYSSEITYEFLVGNELEDYEITYGAHNRLNKKSLLSKLKILKNVFNYYK